MRMDAVGPVYDWTSVRVLVISREMIDRITQQINKQWGKEIKSQDDKCNP